MKSADSILATPPEKVGKDLKPQAKQAVLDFYQNDEYFQQMPGKNNYVSISLETHKQKPLFLCNLKELYQELKIQPLGLGFLNLPPYAQNGVLLLEPQEHTRYVFAVFTRMLLYYAVHQD